MNAAECSGEGEQVWLPTWTAQYPPNGQGVFTFIVLRKKPFSIVLHGNNSSEKISLEVRNHKLQLRLENTGVQLLAEVCKTGVGYDPETMTSYWFSLNRENLVIKYGKGYFMEETTLLTYDFLAGLNTEESIKRRCSMKTIFGPGACRTLQLHDMFTKKDLPTYHVRATMHEQCTAPKFTTEELTGTPQGDANCCPSENCLQSASSAVDVHYYPHPLTVNWPFLVKNSAESSLFDLDKNDFIFTASLPLECQELYANIASTKVDLDWAPQPQQHKLSDAIRYSFETEGKALHEKLKQKKMKYIRVTVGPLRSQSPGIPYILELWPKNHGSPVHCHGNSYGVIKVIHGGLRAEVYNCDMKTILKHYNIRKGDITWMSPFWYQCHRLFNDTNDFCATLQCYRYGAADKKMCPFFDYVNPDGSYGEFFPNGDFTFGELNDVVLSEYQVSE